MSEQPLREPEYSDGMFRQRLCAYCGDLSPYLRKYGRIIHKEACPHRQEPYHQGAPDRTLADERAAVVEGLVTTIKALPVYWVHPALTGFAGAYRERTLEDFKAAVLAVVEAAREDTT